MPGTTPRRQSRKRSRRHSKRRTRTRDSAPPAYVPGAHSAADFATLRGLLRGMRWHPSDSRANAAGVWTVYRYANGTVNRRGKLCDSMTFGKVAKYGMAPEASRFNAMYPAVWRELKATFARLAPGKRFRSATVNRNFQCLPHKDGRNRTHSLIVGMGAYTGGRLCIGPKSYNIRYRPLWFDGASNEHWVEAFKGDRYSVVYYA